MKKIEAIIRGERLEAVKVGLEKIDVNAMTITDVLGRGEQKGLEFTHRAGKYRVDMLPKVKVEVVVNDDRAQAVIDAIVECARTGEIGDGKIFVVPVEETIRIRTGESSSMKG
ncbi:MAG TPA: P-II family nitrogen regulator [Methanomassiliicoccales archaeon]|nr:P-II family nitrogen regulator [Methanomassiliicoccales archaeon]